MGTSRGKVPIAAASAVLMLVAMVPVAFAQSVAVAQLSGVVTDESGGVLPGASVTVTQTDTGLTRSTVTGLNGDYVFTNLPIGSYRITATMPSFRSFEQTGISLNVGDTRSVNIALALGAMTEVVKVQADANLVERRSLSVGSVTPQELIVGLPLNGRNVTQLMLLEGGAVQGDGTAGARGFPGQVAISVAGGTSNSTQYRLDGAYNNDPQRNAGNILPFPDAVQEFRIESGVRSARYGMSTGATVNAETKSGTNAFHGSAFDFMRDHRFNAIEYFEKTENGGLGRDDGLQRHQFGGTIGGPIMRDKLFFFLGVQGTVNKVAPLSTDQTVATAEMLAGDFTRVMSAACRGEDKTLGAPFVDNKIDPALFHPTSLKVVSMLSVADPALDPDGCGRYPIALAADSKEQQYISRVDYQITGKKRVFFRDFFAYFKHPAAFDKDNPNLLDTQGNGGGNRALSHTIATGFDSVIGQNLFSSTRFAYQHTFATREQGEGVPTLADVGVNAWMYTSPGGVPGQDMLKMSGIVSSSNTGIFYVDTPSFSQDFDWTLGAHSVSFGGSWTRPSSDGDGPFQADGNMTFTGLITSGTSQPSGGLPWADFLLGYPESYRAGGSQINNAYVHAVGGYVNDVWRVNSRVTFNAGLRWEPFLAPKDRNGFNIHFSRQNYENGVRSTVYPNAPLGLIFAGDPGFPTNGANSNNQYNQFAPRFGLVLDPAGDATQTIRAGFGIYYDSPQLWTTAHHMLNAPFGMTVDALRPGEAGAILSSCPGKPSQNGCPVDFLDPWNATPGGDPHEDLAHQGEPIRLPGPDTTFPRNGVYVSMPVDANPPRSYQYILSYQRQLTSRLMLDLTYTGNQQRHQWLAGYAENPVVYIPGDCTAGEYGLTADGPCSNTTNANRQARSILTLLNPTEGAFYNANTADQETGIAQAYLDGKSHYNGLKIGLQKRLGDGWSANVNYTLSKCINEGEPSTDIEIDFPASQIDPFNNPVPDASLNEGACANDRRHLFNVSSVLLSPGLGSGFLNVLTRDWQVGLIYQARSGSPLQPGVSDDHSLTSAAENQRPNLVPGGDPYLDEPQWIQTSGGFATDLLWLNMAAFEPAGLGEVGNARRGAIYGPGFWNVDLSFSRIFNLRGGQRVELRVEAFNLFNNVNWANPDVTLGSNIAGRITETTGEPRIMQFAAKFGF